MDRTTLADELRAARFRTTQFRTGYDEGAVDDLIDMLVGQLGTGVADHEILATVRTSRFPTTKARRGYEMGDVDALLARVTSAFGGEPMPASTARPIIEPTDRSMPPATMTGVSATASRPSSTLNLVISKKFPSVKNPGATTANSTVSAAITASSGQPPLERAEAELRLASRPQNQPCSCLSSLRMGQRPTANRYADALGRNRDEDDRALDGALPVRADSQECQRGTDGREQNDAEHGARDAAAAPGDGRSANHDRRNHLHLETDAGVAGNLVEPDGVEHGGESRQRSNDREHRAFHCGGVEPRKARRSGV